MPLRKKIERGYKIIKVTKVVLLGLSFIGINSCTFETRNQISRSIQNWTGTNGVVDVLSSGKVMYRFLNVEKLTTAASSDGSQQARPYRFGYGVIDLNQNYKADIGEKKVYFEVSEYSTQYLYYENPTD